MGAYHYSGGFDCVDKNTYDGIKEVSLCFYWKTDSYKKILPYIAKDSTYEYELFTHLVCLDNSYHSNVHAWAFVVIALTWKKGVDEKMRN